MERGSFRERNAGRVSVQLFDLKYTEALPAGQVESFYWSSMLAQVRAENRYQVRLKTDATGAIRLTITEPQAPVLAGRWKPRVVNVPSPRGTYLSNSDNLQSEVLVIPSRRPRRRAKSITAEGRRRVKEGCAVLGNRYGKKVAFVTLTLPGSTREALTTVATRCRYLQNRFMSAVRYLLDDVDYVWVWELQDRGALHAHVAIGMDSKESFNKLKSEHKRLWRQALEGLSRETGVDLFADNDGGTWRHTHWAPKTEVAWVKKNVGVYMSKYLSKGPTAGHVSDELLPASWWSMSRRLETEVARFRQLTQGGFESAEAARQAYEEVELLLAEDAEQVYDMENPYSKQKIGRVFYFDPDDVEPMFEFASHELQRQVRRLHTGATPAGNRRDVWISTVDEPAERIYLWRE